MDKYMPAVRSHLKLCEAVLRARLAYLDGRPKGLILRRNRMVHTRTMLTLVEELRRMAAHDPDDWFDEGERLPF